MMILFWLVLVAANVVMLGVNIISHDFWRMSIAGSINVAGIVFCCLALIAAWKQRKGSL